MPFVALVTREFWTGLKDTQGHTLFGITQLLMNEWNVSRDVGGWVWRQFVNGEVFV